MIVRCWVELDLHEGTHFPESNSEGFAVDAATLSFVDILKQLIESNDIEEYVQVKIVEE